MVRVTSWIVLCLCLALLVGCAGTRSAGPRAPAETASAPSEAPPIGDLPPSTNLGEAWCRVWVPPVFEEKETKVLVRPAGKRSIRMPAEYGTRPKLVCVAPAKLREVEKPGVWAHEKEDVLVREGRKTYQKVKCSGEPCGECYKLVECPPEFETRCKAVCVEPPKRCMEFTPAQYKLVEERFELKPAWCRVECSPAEYEMRRERVQVKCGHWEWRRNDACEVPAEPEPTLPALEVEMIDSDESGADAGVFEVGDVVRYDLTVRSDVGSEAFPTLDVVFSFPEQLEFISGTGSDGISIQGSGQQATSSTFKVSLESQVRLSVLARVLSVPPTNLIQTTASVRLESGEELASETESTTLAAKGEK